MAICVIVTIVVPILTGLCYTAQRKSSGLRTGPFVVTAASATMRSVRGRQLHRRFARARSAHAKAEPRAATRETAEARMGYCVAV